MLAAHLTEGLSIHLGVPRLVSSFGAGMPISGYLTSEILESEIFVYYADGMIRPHIEHSTAVFQESGSGPRYA